VVEVMLKEWIKQDDKNLIAEGNTRLVYSYTMDYIIKEDVSEEDKPYFCNNLEYNIYKNSTDKEKEFLCPIVDIVENGRYIVCQQCIPLDCVLLDTYSLDVDDLDLFQDVEDFIKAYPEYELDLNIFSAFCKKNNLYEGEVRILNNWGLLDNKLVCLDYSL
jgi:hypothetical protein